MDFRLRIGAAVDLSQTIKEGMTIYMGDPVLRVRRVKHLETDGVNLSELTLGSHTGTHIDAPMHFVDGGEPVDLLSPEQCVGEAVVVDLSSKPQGSEITGEDLRKKLHQIVKNRCDLLIRTRNIPPQQES
jgi:kynurenine formamidase